MKLLSFLHRWSGGIIGLLLAILGLTGAILVWEGAWIGLPGADDPVVERFDQLGLIANQAAANGALRITFASEEIGLHHVARESGAGAYLRQDGSQIASWTSQWDRPELWLFDLHHHLFAGETGEVVAGIAGLFGLMFVVTGSILWWRSRRAFRPRLWPRRLAPGPIVSHHRDVGILAAPLLIVSLVTGVAMLFAPVRQALVGVEHRPKIVKTATGIGDAHAALSAAKAYFPDARLRRIVFPSKPGDPIVVRMRQPFEWTPNGRTQLSFAASGQVTIEDSAAANGSAAFAEKFYPVHSGKVGGLLWKLAMTASGLALAMLGMLATWSFWARRAGRSKPRTTRERVSRATA